MSTSTTSKVNKSRDGVLGPRSNGFNMAIIYGLLFVPLMVVMDEDITVDSLGIPALLLFLLVNGIELFIAKVRNKAVPQWMIVGSFVVTVLTAVFMAMVLQ